VGIALFRQLFMQLRKQPQQEAGVDPGRFLDQLAGFEKMDMSAAGEIALHQIRQLQGRLAEQPLGALLLQYHQPPLNGLDADQGRAATDGVSRLGGAQRLVEQTLQALEIQRKEALLIGSGDYPVERGVLVVVEVQRAGEEQRSRLADGRAQWMAAVTEDVP